MKELIFILLVGVLYGCWAKESMQINRCSLERQSGASCRLRLTKYYYNSVTSQCEAFTYSGCGGNDNRFDSKSACERECLPAPPADEIGDDVEDDADDEDVAEPSVPNLFGKLFQESVLSTMFKPMSDFDGFDSSKLEDDETNENDEDDDGNDDVEEEAVASEKKKRNPFSVLTDFLRPNFESAFKPFGRDLFSESPFRKSPFFKNPFSRKPFFPKGMFGGSLDNFRTRMMKNFRQVDRSFEKMSKVFENITTPDASVKCFICVKIVKIVEYQIKVLQMSLDAILKIAKIICGFFPLAEKKCDKIINDIQEIVKLLDQGIAPKDVCKMIELCPNSTLPEGVTQTVSVKFSRSCSPICNFMKATYDEKALKISQSWDASKLKLQSFCKNNKIIKKCDILFKMLDKSYGLLSDITATQNEEHCRCFKKQPIFDTKKFDPCLRCQQFKLGMANDVKVINQSTLLLATRVKELCDLFPSKECTEIVSGLRRSLDHNVIHMPDICNVTGYCDSTGTETNNTFVDKITKSLMTWKRLIPDPKPMIKTGMGLDWKKFTPDCLFCKKCMDDLKETFRNINETDVDSKEGIYPAVKEGFSLYCHTRSVGGNYTTVCKKISDGIETVHETITKRGNGEGMCKTLGVC